MVTRERRSDDTGETGIRPATLAEFVGQEQLRRNLAVFIAAARERDEPLDHVLFYGPPGLGKTTLAQIVARELGVGFRATFSSSTKSTGSTRRSRKSSIPRWRTASSTS